MNAVRALLEMVSTALVSELKDEENTVLMSCFQMWMSVRMVPVLLMVTVSTLWAVTSVAAILVMREMGQLAQVYIINTRQESLSLPLTIQILMNAQLESTSV